MKNSQRFIKIAFIQILLLTSFSAFSQCFIDFLTVEITACEGDLFDAKIDFEYGFASNQFTVAGNGTNYGTFDYTDLPITLTSLEADCVTEYEFVVTDVIENDCSDFFEWGVVCCGVECNLWDLELTPSDCDGDDFQLTIDFNYEGNTSPTFDWEIVGTTASGYGFFNDLPLTVFAYNANSNDILGFVVKETGNPECFIETSFENPCFDPDECFIGQLNIEASECDGTGYLVQINFEYENTSDLFFLKIDGMDYGSFNYADLPITLDGFESDCGGNLNFEVFDSEFNGTCFTGIDFETPCCDGECEITSIDFEGDPECVEGLIVAEWYIFSENTSETGFDIYVNGIFNSFVQYNGVGPYDIEIEAPDTDYFAIKACDNDNPDCCYILELMNPCFDQSECFISELDVEVSECDGNEFFVIINFEYDNTSDQFTVNGNGLNYGTYAYNDLPITIVGLEGNCNAPYEFIVTDVNNNDCSSDVGLGIVCCEDDPCELFDLVIETSECDGGFFEVTFDFEYSGTNNAFFDWEIPGYSSGFAEFSDLPKTIIVQNTSMNGFDLFINENDNPNCAVEGSFENPCFDIEECFISELLIDVSECDGNQYFVEINFEYANTSDNFFVNLNGENYGPYDYIELPIAIDGLEGNCEESLFFEVYDSEFNGTCTSTSELDPICCEEQCEILSIDFGANPECVDGFIVTDWFIFGENTSEVGYDIYINGVFTTFVEYNGNGPYDIEIEAPETDYFAIKACDNDNPDCCYIWELMNPCFDGEECFIGELNVDVGECEGNQFFVIIDFEYENTSDQFKVVGNGMNYGTFDYADLPITIFDIESDCNLQYEFVVQDLNYNDCASDVGIGSVCCEEDCEMIGLDFGDIPVCNDGLIVTEWFIFGENTSEVGFDIYINNVFETTVEYNPSDWYDFDFEDPGTEYFTIKACDTEIEGCCIVWEFMNPCFEGEPCELFDLVIETSECDGGFFEVTFDFEYTGTTNNFFDWEIPGYSSGFAEFSDLPKTVIIQNTSTNGFGLYINENDNPNCAIEGEFENPCFDPSECFISELEVDVSECDGNAFFVVINFEYENTSDQFYVNGNGNSYGTYSYSDLPITIEFPESNCDIAYEFVVHDVNNNDCVSDIEIGEICCNEEDCFISELDIDVSECEDNVFDVEINFEYENTSDQFFVNTNGENFGPYSYSDLPVIIGPLESDCDQTYEFQVYDSEMNGTCTSEANIGIVCCDGDECFIGELDIDVSECEDNLFNVEINFEYENTSDQFFVNTNSGNFGPYNYSDLPKTIEGLEPDCDQSYEIQVYDSQMNGTCTSETNIGIVCCESVDCDLSELDFDVSECDGGFFLVQVTFEYSGNTNEFFDWEIPGIGSGTELFVNQPLTIEIENTTDPQFTLFINENDNPDCDIVGTFGNPCYDEEECWIDGVSAEVVLCEGDLYNVEINFDYGNVGNTFSVQGNGVDYGSFEYEDLPIVLTSLSADCELEYEFVIIDDENEECSDFVEIGTICCEDFNQINGIQSQTIVDGESFSVTFDITNTTLAGCSIDVYVGGVLYATLENNESTFDLGPFDCGQDNVIEIKLINTCSEVEMTFMVDLSEIECVTGVVEILEDIDLYWNVTQKTMTLVGENNIPMNLQLINAQGSLILSEREVSIGWTKQLDNLPAGLYFVRIVGAHNSKSKGLIKKIIII